MRKPFENAPNWLKWVVTLAALGGWTWYFWAHMAPVTVIFGGH